MKEFLKLGVLVCLVGCLVSPSTSAFSNQYKLNWDLTEFTSLCDTNDHRAAGANSKFIIVDNDETDLTIVFLKVESLRSDEGKKEIDKRKTVDKEVVYRIPKTALPEYRYRYHNGVTFGTLVVPFKMRTRGRTLTGQSSLGPYLGWRTGIRRINVTFVATAGLTTIPISGVSSVESQNLAGLTYGAGVILETIERFQVGLIFGADHLGEKDNPNWEYEDNLWISFSIGFSFLGTQ